MHFSRLHGDDETPKDLDYKGISSHRISERFKSTLGNLTHIKIVHIYRNLDVCSGEAIEICNVRAVQFMGSSCSNY